MSAVKAKLNVRE